jgi:hypothetical protein
MKRKRPNPRYSAQLTLRLVIGERSYKLGAIGRRLCMLREPLKTDPTDAQIVMTVDGEPSIWNVRLPACDVVAGQEVTFEDLSAENSNEPIRTPAVTQDG